MYRTFLGSLTLLLALTVPVGAQDISIPPVNIPSTHWIYPLLDRLAADGLLYGEWLPGRRPVGGSAVSTALDTAVARAARDAPVWLETATAAREWLHEEFGLSDERSFRALPTAAGRLTDGPLTPPSALLAGAELVYEPGRNVGLWAAPALELGEDGVGVPMPRLGAAWSPGPVRVSAHYGAHRLGPGASGGMVLHDAAALPWLEVALDEPIRLPWLLRHLGPMQFSFAASRIGGDALGSTVGFFAGDLRVQLFPWLTGALYRTAVVATEVDGHTLTFDHVLTMLQGSRAGLPANFDDQKASMSYLFRFRIAGVAVNPYLVWAWEDTWEIDEDPGAILGVWLPAIPVADRPVGVRYEYTAFGEPGMIVWPWTDGIWQHRSWYRHSTTRSVYVDGDGTPLGHPLGGYGTEHRLEVEVPLPASGLLLRAAGFTRERVQGETLNPQRQPPRLQHYSNILYDDVPGRSLGGWLEGSLRTGELRLAGRVDLEVGDEGWTRAAAGFQATWLVP